jgi:hypothetical protein
MSSCAAAASLMDDMEFLAALENFDATPIANERVPSGSALDELDCELGVAVWATRATFNDVDEADADVTLSSELVRRTAWYVAGFLLLMSLGAAAAALIFHDRVAYLLR